MSLPRLPPLHRRANAPAVSVFLRTLRSVFAMRFVALLAMYLVMPGATTLAEDVVHVVVAGHTLDSADHDEAADAPHEEHHCAATFHVCGCHAAPATLVTPAASFAAPPTDLDGEVEDSGWDQRAWSSRRVTQSVFKPPRA
jgi:hypothetical protein